MRNSFLDKFFECVTNVDLIIHESNHDGTDDIVANELVVYSKSLHIIVITAENDKKLRLKLLNIMDNLKRFKNKFAKNTKNYRTINSVYDVINEFYFNIDW